MTPRDAFERIVDMLHEAMLDDARWPHTSALIDEACGASGSILAVGGGSATERRRNPLRETPSTAGKTARNGNESTFASTSRRTNPSRDW